MHSISPVNKVIILKGLSVSRSVTDTVQIKDLNRGTVAIGMEFHFTSYRFRDKIISSEAI